MAESKEQFMRRAEERVAEGNVPSTARPAFLAFPENLSNLEQPNYMVFTAMTVSGGVDTRTLKFELAEGLNSVALPIPAGIGTSYTQNWDEQSAGTTTAVLGTKGAGLLKTIGEIGGSGSITDIVGAATNAAKDIGSNIADSVGGATVAGVAGQANAAGGGFVNEMMGFAATAPGIENIVSAAQYGIGKRALDQTMISYGGPTFRSFSWQYTLKPLSGEESQTAHKIVNFFKVRSAPEQTSMQFTRVYNLPEVFRIQFFDLNGESKYLDKIGHCALTEVGVVYGGDRYTTFRGSHAPTEIQLSLSFKEMELLNRQAVANEDGGLAGWPGDTYGLEPDRIPDPPPPPKAKPIPTPYKPGPF